MPFTAFYTDNDAEYQLDSEFGSHTKLSSYLCVFIHSPLGTQLSVVEVLLRIVYVLLFLYPFGAPTIILARFSL